MPNITFVGGGSARFVRRLLLDIFSYEELTDAAITLMDIDAERLGRAEAIVKKIIGDLALPAQVRTTIDQRSALDGADYVIVTIMVGGLECYKSDVEIPARYGIYQTVSDTIGPGGVFRTVRTAPVLRQIAENLHEVSPRAWVLNYANPMAMNVWTLLDCGHDRSVGLCHSIQGGIRSIAQWLELPNDEVRYTAGGLNHVNYYLTLEHAGRDLYPRLREAADRVIAKKPAERLRFTLLEHLGHFPAEGPQHQAEYYPWLAKDKETAEQYGAEPGYGYRVDSENYYAYTEEIQAQVAGTKPVNYDGRSHEYGAHIIHALESGTPCKFYGSVRNRGLIENLPAQAAVEVPCIADANGVAPCRVGRIPPQLAAVMTPHTLVHELAVGAALEKNRQRLYQAVQADPLAGAILTLPKIREMVDEMFAANRAFVDDWS